MPRMNSDTPSKKSGRRAQTTTGPVTMAAVGRMAGVSQVTVSRALSDPSKVSADTLKRIKDAIEVTGFVPNALAGALASRKSSLITALVPSITNSIYSGLLHGFSEIMRSEGYQILLSETGFRPEDEENVLFTHLSRRPDGVLLIGIHHTAGTRKMLLGAGIPVVEVWDITDTPIDFCVGFGHREVGLAVGDFAAGLGHKKALTLTANDERAGRRRDAFAERFGKLTGSVVTRVEAAGPATIAAGRKGLADALEQGFDGSLVFCSSDLMAHGVLIEAQARGIRVPEDLAVIGFGDQEFAEALEPAVTTVRVDRDRLGRVAAEVMHARIGGQPIEQSVYDLGFEIIRRKSA